MKKGFTLIELMIVVAILGILSAIVVGKVQEMRACENERSVKCRQFREKRGQYQESAPSGAEEEVTINGQKYRRVP